MLLSSTGLALSTLRVGLDRRDHGRHPLHSPGQESAEDGERQGRSEANLSRVHQSTPTRSTPTVQNANGKTIQTDTRETEA